MCGKNSFLLKLVFFELVLEPFYVCVQHTDLPDNLKMPTECFASIFTVVLLHYWNSLSMLAGWGETDSTGCLLLLSSFLLKKKKKSCGFFVFCFLHKDTEYSSISFDILQDVNTERKNSFAFFDRFLKFSQDTHFNGDKWRWCWVWNLVLPLVFSGGGDSLALPAELWTQMVSRATGESICDFHLCHVPTAMSLLSLTSPFLNLYQTLIIIAFLCVLSHWDISSDQKFCNMLS